MLDKDALAQLRQLKQQIHDATERAEATLKGTQGRFGFAVLDDGREIFVPPDQMQRAFPGDRVRVIIQTPDEGKPYAELEALLQSPLTTVTGRYRVRGQGHFVEPDPPQPQRWIFLGPRGRGDARPGDYVHCRIQRHPFQDGRAQARVEQVLGPEGRPGLEVDYALLRHDIREPEPCAAASLAEPDTGQYRDLSDTAFVTIDGADTRDMDDALAVTAEAGGWRLRVAIADATAWVQPGSDLERRARTLGTTLYLPGRNLGMLPAAVAETHCALEAGQLRPAMICELHVDSNGQCGAPELYPAMVRPIQRLTYTGASELLSAGEHSADSPLPELARLADALHGWRSEHSPVMPEQIDYELLTGTDGQISSIRRQDKTAAHRIVEECMLAVNRSVASWYGDAPGLFVTHPGFRPERLADVRRLCAQELPGFDADVATLPGYIALMRAVADYQGEYPLRAILSRWLQRARLSRSPAPHFGLGLERYATFTSPIRKFSDFLLHRLVKGRLAGHAVSAPTEEELDALQANWERGRRARYMAEQWLKCNFLSQQPRQPLAGRVCRIHSSGFGVRLHETGIEGNIETRNLPGKYRFDPLLLELRGPERQFRLEQEVQVEVADIDSKLRSVSFRLLDS